MDYQVRFVGDAELPDGVEFIFVRLVDETFLFVKRSAVVATTTGHCDALTRSFNTWERAQWVAPRELIGA